MWEAMMFDPLTYGILRRADFNRDGTIGNDEMYVAIKTGRLSFDHPSLKAKFKMIREVTDHFQVGFTGLTRDEAVFLFAQQRAVFMTTGTWDARSLEQQAEDRFRVGVMDFPLPARDDPYYGELIEGPLYERPMGGFPFAITRTTKHPEAALDFLLFLAGKEQNEKLNRIIGWIPAVKGTKMDPLLEAFEPHLEGVYKCENLFLGGETWIKWWQLYSRYQIDDISYDDMAAEFEPFYKERGMQDFMELQKDWRRGMHVNEQFLAGIRAKAFVSEGDEQVSQWVKYRVLTTSRQVWPEANHARQMNLLEKGPDLGAYGPYEHRPDVLEKVRERLKEETQVSLVTNH
jgi:raffinose/stachyose/melibiose transport system substrate-binding protein